MELLLLIALVIESLCGVGMVLSPAIALGPFGVAFTPTATALARLFGSALLALVVLLCVARRSSMPELKRTAVFRLFAYYLVSTVLVVWTQMTGVLDSLGWGVAAMHAALTAAFGWLVVKLP